MLKIIICVLLGNYLFLLIDKLFKFLIKKIFENKSKELIYSDLKNIESDFWRDLNVKRDFK